MKSEITLNAGKIQINKKEYMIKHCNPCAFCSAASVCTDKVNEYCKHNLEINEWLEEIKK